MRPRCTIESILTYTAVDENGEWIPMKVGINSWITLQPGKQGGHARDAKKYGATHVEGAYKAKILQFRVGSNSSVVSEILVQHAYMQRQLLDLDPIVQVAGACNYLYLSKSTDWVKPQSVLDVIIVLHADVGEAQRGQQTHKDLMKNSVFFYNAMYFPKKPPANFGQLQSIPLPCFDDPSWPLPDMSTTEAFRAKMRIDFWASLKPTVGSQATHINWFMPIHVLVDLFYSTELHRTPRFFVFKTVSDVCLSSLMDVGWDTKVTEGADVVKCIVDHQSIIFRYHLSRSTLYVNFVYNRLRRVRGSQWEYLEQMQNTLMVRLICQVKNRVDLAMLELEVGSTWSLSSVRLEVSLALGDSHENCNEFHMCITEGGRIQEKVNIRNERSRTVSDIMPPKTLQIVFYGRGD